MCVQGYNKTGQYIATQAPIPSTFGDFWKMVWEKNCTTIVVLTNLKEDGRVRTMYQQLIYSYVFIYCNTSGEVSPVLAIPWAYCLW